MNAPKSISLCSRGLRVRLSTTEIREKESTSVTSSVYFLQTHKSDHSRPQSLSAVSPQQCPPGSPHLWGWGGVGGGGGALKSHDACHLDKLSKQVCK